ncbi:5134_t:CDS:2 [Diversispora eburnea]|uniref:5134_t:CDS:1 n=1 Tax=Diversispora eburnea TaxID=1213867 RepID=A0A9N9G3Q0_9GLOM|nr:5134_t:CDS:2 [Diversispora eburnea]
MDKFKSSFLSFHKEIEPFLTIEETVKTLFPDASSANIKKYTKQISKVDELDPVLIIKPNQAWVTNNGWVAYNQAMDRFATFNLSSQRRDEDSRCIFHFRDIQELYSVRDGLRNSNLIPNGFHVPHTLRAVVPATINNPEPIGCAYILIKLTVKKSEFSEDTSFFNVA